MRAEVVREFKGVRDGEVHPRLFRPGDIIAGDLAKAEVRAGRAQYIEAAPRNKAEPPPSPFPAGPGSESSSLPADQAVPRKTSKRQKAALD